MNLPERLPATEDDLDDWSVYIDWLLQLEDMRAEFLAFELALPTDPEPAALMAFHAMAREWCRVRPATPATWCLGHARTLTISGDRPPMLAYPRTRTDPSTGAYSNATEFLKTAAGSRVEYLALPAPLDRVSMARPWRRLMAALPTSCTHLALDIRGGVTDPDDLIDSLPDHITSLTLFNERNDTKTSTSLITDRFDLIDFHYPRFDESSFPSLHAALARTSRVTIRVSEIYASALHPRIMLGAPTDAALVQQSHGYAIALRRQDLLSHQKRLGIIPVRAQLNGLPERHSIRRWPDGRVNSYFDDADLMRRNHRWTLRGAPTYLFSHNGNALDAGEIVAVLDRDTITIDDSSPLTFIASNPDAACRALLWS